MICSVSVFRSSSTLYIREEDLISKICSISFLYYTTALKKSIIFVLPSLAFTVVYYIVQVILIDYGFHCEPVDLELSMSIILKFLNLKIPQWCPAYVKEQNPEDFYHISILINTLLWVMNDCHMQGWIIWKLCRDPWILKTSLHRKDTVIQLHVPKHRPFPVGAVRSLRRCCSHLWGRREVGVHLPVPLLISLGSQMQIR